MSNQKSLKDSLSLWERAGVRGETEAEDAESHPKALTLTLSQGERGQIFSLCRDSREPK